MALRVARPLPSSRRARFRRKVAYGHILVPLVDRTVSEQATAIACQLAADRGARVTAATVIEIPMELPLHAHMSEEEVHARGVILDAAAIGDLHGVSVAGRILRARAAGEALVEEARDHDFEIIVLAAPRKKRAGSSTPIFGKTVDFVLKHAPCRVMVAALPVDE